MPLPVPLPVPPLAPVIVIAPDSFKGSLGAAAVAAAIATGLRRALPDAQLRLRPMADGGEGTRDAFMTGSARRHDVMVTDAAGGRRPAPVALLAAGGAVIESAEIVGITDPHGMRAPVEQRSSRGVGDALRALLDLAHAEHDGVREVFVALGGSSTNDGGAGMLVALGARLLDAAGQDVPPVPEAFARIARIDPAGLDARLAGLSLVAMSDVDNPLCGEHGATAVFGPQKGVRADRIAMLDAALGHYADCLERAMGRGARALPGAGAAGGLGYALLMLGARFAPGARVLADHIGLAPALQDADWLITGEGRSDAQTLRGKAPFVASQYARDAGVCATLLSGAVERTARAALGAHFTGCFSIVPGPMAREEAIRDAAALLADAAEHLARLRFGR
ncbi:glycerate kinase [Robbsia sp. Bb-Pol-6]|uniref:Glycerate kinase n=1 Tax=Robbsia betulipollinis TaxID=2981849 RepID=A0ABT3ZPI3_9BURK|nr:glycerate kinase [Robbsia betulipollinis]MCY0388140.1 glycerate kinase [Robbsia betulipollinis]